MQNTLIIGLMIIIAYLLGSIPSGIIIGKRFYQKDIRQYGSHNTGTTNTYRVLGKTAGTIVLFMDILKGTLAASQPYFFASLLTIKVNPLLIGVFAILGHTYSIFMHFKGGKAVATSAGILLAYSPIFFLVASTIFVLLMYFTRMVSVASMAGMILVTLISLIFKDPILTSVSFILTLFIFYRHRDNIKRILNGTENKVPFGFGAHKKAK